MFHHVALKFVAMASGAAAGVLVFAAVGLLRSIDAIPNRAGSLLCERQRAGQSDYDDSCDYFKSPMSKYAHGASKKQ